MLAGTAGEGEGTGQATRFRHSGNPREPQEPRGNDKHHTLLAVSSHPGELAKLHLLKVWQALQYKGGR